MAQKGMATRNRTDPRRDATRDALIEAAEALIGEAGVDGVSLRRIGAAAGSLNKTVVTYHFGSKEALIEAIYRHRLPELDQRRGELLERAELAGTSDDLATLLWVMWQPLFEQVSATGMHSYARFLGSVIRSDMGGLRKTIASDFPVTAALRERIASLLPPHLSELREMRWSMVANMVLGSILLIDYQYANSTRLAEQLFNDTIAMAALVLVEPESAELPVEIRTI